MLALAVLAAAVAVAVVVPLSLAVLVLIVPVLAVITGPKLEVGRVGQAAITFMAALIGVLAPRVLLPAAYAEDVTMLTERRMLLAMPVLAVAAVRALMVAPRFGAPVTLIAALVTVTAAGGARTGVVFPLLAAAFVALAVGALAVDDAYRAPVARRARSTLVAVSLVLLTATTVTAVSTEYLPRLHSTMVARLVKALRRPHSGFSKYLTLDSLSGMLMDDTVALRLRGSDVPPLLRGGVFTNYVGTRWEKPERLPPAEVVEVSSTRPGGDDVLEVEYAGHPERYFLPLDARDVANTAGFFDRDLLGVHRPTAETEAKRVWFRRQGQLRVALPGTFDTEIPRRLRLHFQRLARVWDVHTGPPRQRLERIEARLHSDYGYSLSVERTADLDPVLDFLLVHREGHCEYFASAMALLARASGIPARVITGYRVAETSRFGYHIVRQRHAHAWVEAWIDGRWTTFDPTPPAALAAAAPETTPLFGSLTDGLATSWEALDDWLFERSAFEFSLALVLLAGGFLMARVLRARRERARRQRLPDAPLPGFVALHQKLANLGVVRTTSETLARFARRVEQSSALPADRSRELADLIRAYATLRYAGRGDASALDHQLASAARAL